MIGLKFFVEDEIVEAISEPYQGAMVVNYVGVESVEYETRIMIKWLKDNGVTEACVGCLDSMPTDGEYEKWNNK